MILFFPHHTPHPYHVSHSSRPAHVSIRPHHGSHDESDKQQSAGEAVIFVIIVLSVFVVAAWLEDKIP